MCKEIEIMMEKSWAEGFAEGFAEAKLKKTKETVLSLHTMGYEAEYIAKAINVPPEQIKQWITILPA